MGVADCISVNSCRESLGQHMTLLVIWLILNYPLHTHTHTQTYTVILGHGNATVHHIVFILLGFLFECVLLTGLLMASPSPGQGSVSRPYPGHARRAGGTRKNEVNPGTPVLLKDSLTRNFFKEI